MRSRSTCLICALTLGFLVWDGHSCPSLLPFAAAQQTPANASAQQPSASQPARPDPKENPTAQSQNVPAAPLQPPSLGGIQPSKAPSTDDESVATIRKTVNEVNVVFTVTDKHGRYVKDLRQDDF